jgi:DNA polymerase III subunit alpha
MPPQKARSSSSLAMPDDEMWFHTHAHSHFSVKDGMPTVLEMIDKVVENRQPALALTDHGVMSGSFSLYQLCKKKGLLAFPGEEFYLVNNVNDESKENRYHVGMFALTEAGYTKLVALSSRAHLRERYHRFPLIDWSDLKAIDFGYDIALTTGCYFGAVIQALIDPDKGFNTAKRIASTYAQLVPNTFIEIQMHGTDHGNEWTDDLIAEKLYRIATVLGLPILVSQDAHYTCPGDKPVHTMMKDMSYFGSEPGSYEFPGDSYHLADTAWVRDHYEGSQLLQDIWRSNIDSCDYLIDMHKVKIPVLDSYSFRMPDLKLKNPDAKLRKLCEQGLTDLDLPPRYRKRMDEELDVISDVGFSDYFLLVHKVVTKCLENGWIIRIRGSAAGSLVCYLLGMTDVDPMKWNLLFSRFLTRERTKPPDIDLDMEDRYRDDVIEMLKKDHPCIQISTLSTLGHDEETDRGSIVDEYVRMKKRQAGTWTGNVMNDVPEDEKRVLLRLAQMDVKKSVGAHAAGFAFTNDKYPIERYVPTLLIPSSNKTITQMTMNDIDEAGYVKLDLLGSNYLTRMAVCLESIRSEDGLDYGPRGEFIPNDDPATMKMLRQGVKGSAIFQLEGGTAARGCREMQVAKTKDVVALMAIYRPGVLGKDDKDSPKNRYFKNKADPEQITYEHPIIEKHLKETFGVPLFQEQVLSIMTDIGMTVEDLNKILKALKLSNKGTAQAHVIFDEAQSKFNTACNVLGLTDVQTKAMRSLVETFASYGFNRAHATSYGMLAYRCAFLKAHFPLLWMHATLSCTTGDKIRHPLYIKETRRMGFHISAPCVNRGKSNWTIDQTARGPSLRKGLQAVKGVGGKAGEEIERNAPYTSMDDLIQRTRSQPVSGAKNWYKDGTLNGVLEALRKTGALRCLGVDP